MATFVNFTFLILCRSLTKACMWQNFRWVRKETKMKTKKLFSFPPSPIFFLFSLFWPRTRMTAVFNFDNVEDNTTYYTHYIRWIIEPKSKQKTTCYYNIQQKLKNEMKKPDVCLEEKTKKRIAKVYKKLIFFYLMIFPFTLK